MTVAELIAKLQDCDPNAVVLAPGNDGPGLLGDGQGLIRTGWYCPGLLADGRDDFWGDRERCTDWEDGIYHPRPEDQAAVYLKAED